jgi:hypothetical protein
VERAQKCHFFSGVEFQWEAYLNIWIGSSWDIVSVTDACLLVILISRTELASDDEKM